MIVNNKQGLINLMKVYEKAKDWEFVKGYTYYSDLHNRIMEAWISHQDSSRTWFAKETWFAVFAALSPNNDEEGNFRDMVNAFKTDPDYWEHFKPSTYPANKEKVWNLIYKNAAPEGVLKGLKTYSFYRNILDPWGTEYVTVDGHMVNVWNGKRVRLTETGISSTEYAAIENGLKTLGRKYGVAPCKIQSVLWLTWRRIHGIKWNHFKNGDQGVLSYD